MQWNRKRAILQGETSVRIAPLGLRIVEVLSGVNQRSIHEDPCLADPAQRHLFLLVSIGINGGPDPGQRWRLLGGAELPVEIHDSKSLGADGLPCFRCLWAF